MASGATPPELIVSDAQPQHVVNQAINGVTLDPSRSTAAIAPDYLMLTPDEQNIWAGMTDDERNRAILFITNGATLVSSLGAH